MAALLCTKSEGKTKTLRNCGINPKTRLILSWLIYIYIYIYNLVLKEIHEYVILPYDALCCGSEFKML